MLALVTWFPPFITAFLRPIINGVRLYLTYSTCSCNESVLNCEVSVYSEVLSLMWHLRLMYSVLFIEVSFIQRCPLFRGVLIEREVPLYKLLHLSPFPLPTTTPFFLNPSSSLPPSLSLSLFPPPSLTLSVYHSSATNTLILLLRKFKQHPSSC